MTSRLIALAALIALAPFAARAADMPYVNAPRSAVAYYSWDGYYAGFNIGYGFGTSTWEATAFNVKPTGLLAGLTLGVNWQAGAFVYGIEGDIDLSTMKHSATCGAFTCETRNGWLGTVRGRIGMAFGQFMPYLTGGLAVGDIKASSSDLAFPGSRATQYGWTIGGGIEAALTGNWSAKLEYLYVDLGTFDCRPGCGTAVPSNVGLSAGIVRIGLNYRFSGPIYSRY